VTGVGLDVVEIARFRAILDRRPSFATRVFTDSELADLADRRDRVPGLAARFAAKEAAMKALGIGLGAVNLNEIEVHRSASGAPELRMNGRAAVLASTLGAGAFHLSMTHSEAIAAAMVLVQ
jgi:holo-[acyl-carrier protein] synthase